MHNNIFHDTETSQSDQVYLKKKKRLGGGVF